MSVMFAWLGDLCEDASDKLEDIEGLLRPWFLQAFCRLHAPGGRDERADWPSFK